MTRMRLAARSARDVAVCLPLPHACYHLPQPAAWRLLSDDGTPVREGRAGQVVLLLHDLDPDTPYRLEAAGEALDFRTPPCAGLLSIADFGAVEGLEDGAEAAAANARAIASAIAALPAGGTLLVPPGRWLSAPVELRSRMTLRLAEGAELRAPADRTGWPQLPARDAGGGMLGSWEGLPAACFRAPLHAVKARDLTIAGPGLLDGGGDRGDWWSWPKETRDGARRPRGLHLVDCAGVTLLGFAIRNAPSWTIHPQGCTDLTAVGLHIMAPADSPNTDGFNPEMCEGVRMEGIRFSVGDDCIAIKAGKRGDAGEADHLRPCRDIAIRHCLMERGHGGVVLGSEMSGGISDIRIEACEMIGTDRGLRLKTRRGRGGSVTGVTFRDILMDGVQTAFSANAFYNCDPDGNDGWVQDRAPAPVTDLTPRIGAITVEDIEIRRLAHAAGAFLGLPEAPIGPLRLQRVRIVSLDPDAQPGFPVMADRIPATRHAGIFCENAVLEADAGLPRETRPLSLPIQETAK